MQVEDEKHVSTSLNTKTSSDLPASQSNPSRRGVVIVLCAVAIWSITPCQALPKFVNEKMYTKIIKGRMSYWQLII